MFFISLHLSEILRGVSRFPIKNIRIIWGASINGDIQTCLIYKGKPIYKLDNLGIYPQPSGNLHMGHQNPHQVVSLLVSEPTVTVSIFFMAHWYPWEANRGIRAIRMCHSRIGIASLGSPHDPLAPMLEVVPQNKPLPNPKLYLVQKSCFLY